MRAFSIIFAVLLSAPALAADGKAIYKKLCIECHGKSGEGVKGKYDQQLQGDRSLERLARYIDKNMPDEHPEKCVGKDAEAVAKYIYDAFYSVDARLRNHPPRIEVAHLTNRQLINSIADLIGRFNDAENKIGSEHGLAANYYDSRNFNNDKKLYSRVDREVSFDFGDGGPEKSTTNEFSIQWRGSLIADETGFYDIIVKTPLGSRLWLNDDDNPAIDAWVSSTEAMEHKISVRLIGGRAYPLRLECFRFKDKKSSMALLWKPPHGPQQTIPAQNLVTSRTAPTFVIRTPFPADDSSFGFERGVAVSKAWEEATTGAALEVAAHVLKRIDRYSQSKAADTNRVQRLEDFCARFVTAAFRRPLTVEEIKIYVAEQFKAAKKPEEAVKRAVLLALKSPRFLYLGLESKKPDDYEIAARLSYELWDSMPDAELMKAADKGALRSQTEIEAQSKRMLADVRAHAKVRYFLQQWLQMDRGDDLSKDAAVYPTFTPEIAADLRTSLLMFLDNEVWNGPSDYRRLLQADYLYVNDRLAKFYGLTATNSADFTKVKFDPTERAGVITHPFLLSAFAYAKQSSPIHRGVFLTRNIVGRALKPPPIAVAFKDAEFAPNLTMREKVSELTKPQNCQACHSVINPLGFSLEHFDAVGRYRTQDNGKPVDTLSEYLSEDGRAIKLSGPRDIADFAANSPEAQKAFVEHLFQEMVKQPPLAYGRDTIQNLRESFAASNCNIQQLMMQIATATALHGVPHKQIASKP